MCGLVYLFLEEP